MKKTSKFKIVEIIITIISIVVCFTAYTNNGYDYLFLMPITYLICRIVCKFNRNDYRYNIGYFIIDVLTFLKYSIMPLLIVLMRDYYNGVLTAEIPASSYVEQAIILLCIECISIFAVAILFKKFKKNIKPTQNVEKKVKFGPIMILFFIISFITIIMYSESFFPSQLFVIDSDFAYSTIDSSFDGLIKIIFFEFKLFFMLYGIQFFYFKYKEKHNFLYVIGIILMMLIYIALNTSTSRWNTILPFIVLFYILFDFWFKNNMNRNAMIVMIVGIIISTISISVYKFSWLFTDDISLESVTTVMASQIQEYLSGPRAVAQGLEAIEMYDKQITYTTLFNDFTGSIPFISHYVNQKNRINIYYNYYLKGYTSSATQIMPMITIGYKYFSQGLCYLFTILFIYLSLEFGYIASYKEDIHRKYIYSYLSIWCALCVGFNTQIIFGWFVSSFLPFIILMFFNDKFVLRRNIHA